MRPTKVRNKMGQTDGRTDGLQTVTLRLSLEAVRVTNEKTEEMMYDVSIRVTANDLEGPLRTFQLFFSLGIRIVLRSFLATVFRLRRCGIL